jgi:hypothetical protein
MTRRLLPMLLLAAWLTPAGAEPVFPPALRIGLEPPAGMVLAKDFPGFEDTERKVKITILDLPVGAYESLEAATFAQNQGAVQDVRRESFPFTSGIGFLVSGRAPQDGATFYKWYLLAKSVTGPVTNLTTLINVDVPEAARAVYTDEVVRKALASVTFRPAPIEEQLKLMPFTIGERAGFRAMQALPSGGVIMTDGPDDDLSKQAYIIVSIGQGAPTEAGERGRFARDLLNNAPLRSLSVRSAEPMRIAGSPGYEVRATATNLAGIPVQLVQWVRFGGGGFMRIIGVSQPEAWDAMFNRFRAVRDGIDAK